MNYANAALVGVFTVVLTWICTAANDDSSMELNRYCQKRTDCPDFGYWCDGNMTCQCAGMYIANSDKTRCLGGVRQKCSYDDDCIKNAFCEKQTMCRCKKKYHPSDGGLVCMKNSSATRWTPQVFLKYIPLLLIFFRIS